MPRISSSSAAISSSLQAGMNQKGSSGMRHSRRQLSLAARLLCRAGDQQVRHARCSHPAPAANALGLLAPQYSTHVCSRRMSLGLGSSEAALGLGLAGVGASLPARLAGPRDEGGGASSTGPELRRPRRGSGSRSSLMSASSAAAARSDGVNIRR